MFWVAHGLHLLESYLIEIFFGKRERLCSNFFTWEGIGCHVLVNTVTGLWQIIVRIESLIHLGVLISRFSIELLALLLIVSRDHTHLVIVPLILSIAELLYLLFLNFQS